ncbi:type II toxin-antitoxin system HicB family antitoxin [Herpetosiphon sp. NSE202]|uniref:type II toxin-antitoxin system HicB family antitoxin n=1 Tax=Herpetosiphon sp. NSE202 TaxID=3351349 RepID=UPI003630B11E
MRYAIVIEQGPNNCSGYILDVLGCVATGETPEEVKQLLQEAIVFHLEGEEIPPSTTLVDYIEFEPEAKG